MRAPLEVSIELTAQELLAPPASTATVEVDDICAFDPLPLTHSGAASSTDPAPVAADEVIEIELTAAQIDALLSQ